MIRDIDVERQFLIKIVELEYALLQRDWNNPKHGDLDIVLSSASWRHFIDHLINFAIENDFKIVKAYEIEYGIICIVVLTKIGHLHLDVAIAPCRKILFKLDLNQALVERELKDSVFIINQKNEEIYKLNKRTYKKSIFGIWLMRLMNFKVLFDRLFENLIFMPGLVIYIPYVKSNEILKSDDITNHVFKYLTSKLFNKYC